MKHPAISIFTSLLFVGQLAAQGGSTPSLEALLIKHRAKRAGMYDSVESSVLGKAASPAEFAATHRNWREYYSKPAEPLPDALRAELEKTHGYVKIFGAPRAGAEYPLGILGAHAIDAAGQPELTVTRVDAGSPAEGKLMVGDVIVGANGRVFPDWEDPRVPMGYVIAAAQTQAHNGQLTLHVAREGKVGDVAIELPIATPYDEIDPYSGPRAQEVASAAVQYILENGDDTFWDNLFLMGCGDERALARVRDNMRAVGPVSVGVNNWGTSYMLVTLCEYYLLTGDKQVLPTIQSYVTALEGNQMFNGGWSHAAPGGYGCMIQVGQAAMIGLTLAKECGVEVDPLKHARGVQLVGRFIGTYTAYGDHAPGVARYNESPTPGTNGRVAAHAVLYHLLGEPAIAKRSGRRTSYIYRGHMAGHAERIFAIAWSAPGPLLASKEEYSMYANNALWIHELARQRDGALRYPGYTRYHRNTGATGMAFAAASKRLRIGGKPKGTPPMFPVRSLPAAPPAPEQSSSTKPKKQPNSSAGEGKWDVVKATMKPVGWDDSVASANFNIAGDPKSYNAFNLTLSTKLTGEVWLNGRRIAAVPSGGKPQKMMTLTFDKAALSLLKRGANVIGIKSASIDEPVKIQAAFAPCAASGQTIKVHKPDFGKYGLNGWSGTYAQYCKNAEWFFEGKSPREIARYLAYPDGHGAKLAYTAMAQGGREAVALCKRLVTDTHAGLRVGAWDSLAEMDKNGVLTDGDKQELVAVALKQLPREDPYVGMALLRAVGPLAKGKDLGHITATVARMDDMLARKQAMETIAKQMSGDPEATIMASIPIMEAKLVRNDIRSLSSTMSGVSKYAKNEAAKEALPALAGVLDEVAPVTSGMFSDGLTHGGLDIVDFQLNPETEKTPQLAAGLTRIHMRGYSDWPGWAYSGLYARRLVYRLTSQSASEIRRAAKERVGDYDIETEEGKMPKAVEMLAWADLLERTRGSESRLKTEALRMATSKRPGERTVALSLVWPSHRTIEDQGGRHSRKGMPDVVRINDPEVALKIALSAAADVDANSTVDWLMIWSTVAEYGAELDEKTLLPVLSAYFDRYAWCNRATYHFDGVEQAWKLADKLVNDRLNAPQLANGLAKTYATYSSQDWHNEYEPKLLATLKKMNKASRAKLNTAIREVETFKESGPESMKEAVFDRWCTNKQFQAKVNQIRDIARN